MALSRANDLAKERERHLPTGKRAERTMRAPSSTDVPALLLSQAIRAPEENACTAG